MHFPIRVGVIWVLIVVLPCTDRHKYLTRENRKTMDRLCGARQRPAAISQQQYSLFARVEKSSLSIDSEVNPCFGEKTLQPKLKGRWTEYMSRGWKVYMSIFPILRYPNEGICLQKTWVNHTIRLHQSQGCASQKTQHKAQPPHEVFTPVLFSHHMILASIFTSKNLSE